MGVKYANFTRIRAILNFLLEYAAPTVLSTYADDSHNIRLQRLFLRLRGYAQLARLAHFAVFLANGGAPSLVRRLLGIQTVYNEPPTLGIFNLFLNVSTKDAHSFR